MPVVKKTATFARTVTYSSPGPGVDEMIPGSFVAHYEQIPDQELDAQRQLPGGIKDSWFAKRALKAAADVKDHDGNALTGDKALQHVLADSIKVGAATRKYFQTITEGIAGKNSKT